MKKIISHYYLFIAILLVIADQFFIRLLLHSDLAAGLSDFAYYLSDMMLNFLWFYLLLLLWFGQGNGNKLTVENFKDPILFIPS